MFKIQKSRFKQFMLGALVAALGAGTYVIAAVTFSEFQSGTTISASEMNAKLNALKDAVNANTTAASAIRVSVPCPPRSSSSDPRFTDNNDGTVCDADTGLMWEKKTGVVGGPADLNDPHNVNNLYSWSGSLALLPNGTLFTGFLAQMQREDSVASNGTTITTAGYTDWRIPNIVELRSILQALSPNCTLNPCIDPVFGPTASFYWSSSSDASSPGSAWAVNFSDGVVGNFSKIFVTAPHARAVRGGR